MLLGFIWLKREWIIGFANVKKAMPDGSLYSFYGLFIGSLGIGVGFY